MELNIPSSAKSLEELNEIIRKEVHRSNTAARKEFDGVSPEQMHFLLHFPFTEKSLLKVNPLAGEDFKQVYFLQVILRILQEANTEKGMPLTAKGYLPPTLLNELHAGGLLNDYWLTRRNQKRILETDSGSASLAHFVVVKHGLARKLKNKLVLTKKGKLLINKPQDLLLEVLHFFMFFLAWDGLDGYNTRRIGQLGAGFSLYLLLKHGGEKRPASFYAEKYFSAFPQLMEELKGSAYHTASEYAHLCYIFRTFEQFLVYFGFASIEHVTRFDNQRLTIATPVFKKLFSLKQP